MCVVPLLLGIVFLRDAPLTPPSHSTNLKIMVQTAAGAVHDHKYYQECYNYHQHINDAHHHRHHYHQTLQADLDGSTKSRVRGGSSVTSLASATAIANPVTFRRTSQLKSSNSSLDTAILVNGCASVNPLVNKAGVILNGSGSSVTSAAARRNHADPYSIEANDHYSTNTSNNNMTNNSNNQQPMPIAPTSAWTETCENIHLVWLEVLDVMSNKHFVLLLIAFTLFISLLNAILTVFNQILLPYGYRFVYLL